MTVYAPHTILPTLFTSFTITTAALVALWLILPRLRSLVEVESLPLYQGQKPSSAPLFLIDSTDNVIRSLFSPLSWLWQEITVGSPDVRIKTRPLNLKKGGARDKNGSASVRKPMVLRSLRSCIRNRFDKDEHITDHEFECNQWRSLQRRSGHWTVPFEVRWDASMKLQEYERHLATLSDVKQVEIALETGHGEFWKHIDPNAAETQAARPKKTVRFAEELCSVRYFEVAAKAPREQGPITRNGLRPVIPDCYAFRVMAACQAYNRAVSRIERMEQRAGVFRHEEFPPCWRDLAECERQAISRIVDGKIFLLGEVLAVNPADLCIGF